jgi:hypothetical protein
MAAVKRSTWTGLVWKGLLPLVALAVGLQIGVAVLLILWPVLLVIGVLWVIYLIVLRHWW